MKEYIKPFVEVIELPKDDIIVTSGGPRGPEDGDTHLNPGSIGPFGSSRAPARNGLYIE